MRISHKNIMPMKGICSEHDYCMVLEWMDNGDLQKYVKDNSSLNREKMVSLCTS